MPRRLLYCALALASMFCISAAECEPPASNEQAKPTQPDVNYRQPEADRDCLAWTDSCVNCSRSEAGASFTCSNIGISCQPKQVECTSRAKPAENPKPPEK
jgi:hypothetical protein